MKIDSFSKIFNDFIDSENEKVMLVKGEWGIGKTYYIDNALQKVNHYKVIKVSMFGVDKIEDINRTISDSIKSFLITKNGNQVLKTVTSVPFISKFLPQESIDITKYEIEFNRSVIFLDDLERTDLDLDKILGYVDRIKNNSSFKFILAINDEQLKNKAIWEVKEKVVDKEIRLKSTSDYLIKDIFKDDYKLANDIFTTFNVTNLRTIIKSKKVMDYFLSMVENLDSENINQLKTSCILFCAYYYSLGVTADYDKNQFKDQSVKVHTFNKFNPFNSSIESYLDSQNIDDEIIKIANDKVVKNQIKTYIEKDFIKLREIIGNSFHDNHDEVINACHKILTNIDSSCEQFTYSLTVLVELGETLELSTLKNWINGSSKPSQTTISYLSKLLSSDKEASDYLDKFKIDSKEVMPSNNDVKDNHAELLLIIEQLSQSNIEYWEKDIENYTQNDWIELFKSDKSVLFISSRIKQFVEIINNKCGANLRDALIQLKSKPLQNYRLKNIFSVDLLDAVDKSSYSLDLK